MTKAFVDSNCWGTSRQILEKYEQRQAIVGDMQVTMTFSFSGMTYEEVEKSMTLYAKEVAPELRSWSASDAKQAAA